MCYAVNVNYRKHWAKVQYLAIIPFFFFLLLFLWLSAWLVVVVCVYKYSVSANRIIWYVVICTNYFTVPARFQKGPGLVHYLFQRT